MPGVRAALRACRAPVVAVSPIVAGQAVKGPTAKMMAELGLPVDAATPARRYRDFLDLYIADEADARRGRRSRHPGRADPHPDAEPRRPRGAGPHRPRRRRARPEVTDAADIWAVVPVKDTAAAKQRLAPALAADLRQGLALAMLEDVLAALAEARGLAGRVLVTIDPAARDLAARYGAQCVGRRRRDGHTGAVTAAARRLAAEGRGAMLTLPGDIPLVTAAEIERLIARASCRRPSFTIAPSHDEMGSNAILMSPPDAVPLRFGDDSFLPHLAAARGAPASSRRSCSLPGIALDIDNPADLAHFCASRIAHASGPVARANMLALSHRPVSRRPTPGTQPPA